ncbi:hypothetical protein PsorP6_018442 [Peronosclerospora sorghi]|nr:hypothetical protein PsorP6_018442 [Peronosclerospora sorghi]
MDNETVQECTNLLTKQGLKVSIWNQSHGVQSHQGDLVTLTTEPLKGGGGCGVDDYVRHCARQRAFPAGLGLEQMGIQTNKRGRIQVDEAFWTQGPGIFAMGDVIQGAMLAHKAEEEAHDR